MSTATERPPVFQMRRSQATIHIYNDVGGLGFTSNDLAQELKGVSSNAPITVRINSVGGSYFEGLAIFNVLRSWKGRVTTIVDGIAASIASVIFLAGDVRKIAANAAIVIHNPFTDRASGDSSQLDQQAKNLKAVEDQVVAIYSPFLSVSPDEIRVLMSRETMFNAEEAQELGFATAITAASEVAAKFDFQAFARGKEMSTKPTTIDTTTKLRQEAADDERRIDKIRSYATDNIDDPLNPETLKELGTKATTMKGFSAYAIEKGMDADQFELYARRAAKPDVGAASIHARSPLSYGEPPKILGAALMCKIGFPAAAEKVYGAQIMECSKQLHSAHMGDIVDTALRLEGRDLPSNRFDRFRMAISTNSLSTAMADSVHNSVREEYNEMNASWRAFCKIVDVRDFTTHQRVQLSLGHQLDLLPADGEIKHHTVGESTVSMQAHTYASQIRVPRTDLVNDNIDLLSSNVRHMARLASRKQADVVYTAILDSTTQWTAGNANLLTGAGSDLDSTSLSDAIEKMRKQTDGGEGNDVDIAPRVLLVPPELEYSAIGLLESAFIERDVSSTDAQPTGNPLQRRLSLEVESRLSNTIKFSNASTTAFWLWAGPIDEPAYFAALGGETAPQVEFFDLMSDPNTLGVSWRVYTDFGFALGETRASVKSDGA